MRALGKMLELVNLSASKRQQRMLLNKEVVSILLINSIALICAGQTIQTYNIDSLKKVLSTNLSDTNRISALNNLGRNIEHPDTTLVLAEQAIALSRKVGFKKGEAEAFNNLGYWFNQKGNYPKALEYYLRSIQISENINFESGLKRSFNSISTVYLYLKDYKTSIAYARKARQLAFKQHDLNMMVLSTSWLSKGFLELHQNDSALKYAQHSYEFAIRRKEPFPLYFATARLGEVHEAEGNFSLALEYSRMSLDNSKKDGRYFRIAAAHQQVANVFKSMGATDSCRWHAEQSFNISEAENLAATLLSSSLLLSELHDGKDDTKSLKYHKLAMVAQDSLYSQKKNQQIEALRLTETLRQQEMQALHEQEIIRRNNNLQYAAIAFGLVLFVIIFLLVSHSVIARPGLIRFLGILALLILFEFINLLLGPFVDQITNHSPVWMLLIMVLIAALLIPIHHRLEKLFTNKLVEKNNQIRLAAAKKVIATLEDTQRS